MPVSLPPALQAAVVAINAGDEEAFVAAFVPGGLINDWGRILKGHDGVRSWARSDAIGARAVMSVTAVTATGSTTHVVFDWKSRFFNGHSEAYVTPRACVNPFTDFWSVTFSWWCQLSSYVLTPIRQACRSWEKLTGGG